MDYYETDFLQTPSLAQVRCPKEFNNIYSRFGFSPKHFGCRGPKEFRLDTLFALCVYLAYLILSL